MKKDELIKDYKELKALTEKMNLYETNYTFFVLNYVQVFLLEIIGVVILRYSGYDNWFTYMIAVFCQTIAFVGLEFSWVFNSHYFNLII